MAKVYLKKQPTFQIFTAVQYTITVTAASANVGAVYTNNGQYYTVTTALTGGTTLLAQGTGDPLASGTLTLVSGTGAATITYSAFTEAASGTVNYVPPTGIVPSRIRVRMTAGGGGGGGVNNDAAAGSNTTFGSIFTCTGGAAGSRTASGGSGSTGGSATIVPVAGVFALALAGNSGAGSMTTVSATQSVGGMGGASPFMGTGLSTENSSGINAIANSGSGGSGCTNTAANAFGGGGGAAGGYIEAVIPNTSPAFATSYPVAVGAGGVGGSGARTGGNGAGGVILIEEFYD